MRAVELSSTALQQNYCSAPKNLIQVWQDAENTEIFLGFLSERDGFRRVRQSSAKPVPN
jgi:hypothetical protein